MKNKIGWCNLTFNPVWGCLNKCEYCYAQKMAKRFAGVMTDKELEFKYPGWKNLSALNKKEQNRYCSILYPLLDFTPIWLESNFRKLFPKKPQRIFVGSMSEIYYWEDEWIEKVIEKVKQYPQHIFQFLTRYPEVYDRYIFPKNCWLGVTITREKDFERGIPYLFITSCNITFVSVEPILEYINPGPFSNANIDWVILGAETGGRKDKVFAKRRWIESILIDCHKKGIPVYIKDSIIKWQPQLRKFKEFPKVK